MASHATLDGRQRSTASALAIVHQMKAELAMAVEKSKKKFAHLDGSVSNKLSAKTKSSMAKQREDMTTRNASLSASRKSLKSTHRYLGRPKSSRSRVGSLERHYLKNPAEVEPSVEKSKRKSLKTELKLHTEALKAMYDNISKRKEEISKKQEEKSEIKKPFHRKTMSFSQANFSFKDHKTSREKSKSPKIEKSIPKVNKSLLKTGGNIAYLNLGVKVCRKQGSKNNLFDRSTSVEKTPFLDISNPQSRIYSRKNSWTRTLLNKPLQKESPTRGEPREISELHQIYNIFNQCYISTVKPHTRIKATLGRGNNHALVWQMLEGRQMVDYSQTPASSQLVWTQSSHPQSHPSVISTASRYHVKHIKSSDSEVVTKLMAGSVAMLIDELMASRLFRFDTNQATISFERLVNSQKICCVSSENVNLVNHIKGLRHISRKNDLAHTVINFCTKVGVDPFIIIPKTFFLRRQHLTKDLDETIKKIGENRKGFAFPCILKPGEFTNRGTGVVMAYSEDELRNKCRDLFSTNKKVANAVVQSYIHNPLLFKGRKFDLRCYALVVKSFAKTSVFWYRLGYMRTSSYEYNINSKDNLMVHLTNEAVQVKDKDGFGKYEPGNKVYYGDIDRYYSDHEEFKRQNKGFLQDIVPLMKVFLIYFRQKLV